MEQKKEYFAFISYKSEDVEWATWLQHELEHYHLPASFNGRTDVPQELRPVFRDIDELSAGNLPEQIKQALANSQNLIVICSPQSAKSPWVNQEVETFIALGRTGRIFPFIVEGNSPSEFFPPALRNLPKKEERLGGDVSKKGRDAAFVKVVAGMLGVGFDSLWNRYEKEKAEEERKQREQRDRLLISQSRFLAEKANDLVDKGDSYTARLLALEALPKDLENPDRPYVAEAEAVFRRALSCDTKVLGGNGKRVRNVVVSPDGKTLFSQEGRDDLVVYDIVTGRIKKVIDGRGCIKISFTQDGWIEKHMENGDIYILNPYHFICREVKKRKIAGSEMRHIKHGTYEKALCFNTSSGKFEVRLDGTCIYLKRTSNANTEIIHLQNTKIIKKKIQKKTNIVWETYSSDGKMRVVSKRDFLEIYDSRNRKTRKFGGFHGRFYPLAFSEEGIKEVCRMENLRLLQNEEMIEDGFQDKYLMDDLSDFYPGFHYVTFSNDGKYIASASQDCTIRIFNTENLKLEHIIKTNKVVGRLSINNNNSLIASLSDEMQVWDIVSGICLQTFDCCEERAIYVIFENNKVSVEYSSGTIQIWNFSPLQELINESIKQAKNNSLSPEERKKYYLD